MLTRCWITSFIRAVLATVAALAGVLTGQRLSADNMIQGYNNKVSVQCVGQIRLETQIFAYGPLQRPAKTKLPQRTAYPLAPGIYWLGDHRLVAASDSGPVQWSLSIDKTGWNARQFPKPPEIAESMCCSKRGVYLFGTGQSDGFRELKNSRS